MYAPTFLSGDASIMASTSSPFSSLLHPCHLPLCRLPVPARRVELEQVVERDRAPRAPLRLRLRLRRRRRTSSGRGTASEAKRVTATNMKKLRQRHAKSAKNPGSLRSPGIAANLHRPASAVPASHCSIAHTANYQRMRGGRSRWQVRIRAAHTMES